MLNMDTGALRRTLKWVGIVVVMLAVLALQAPAPAAFAQTLSVDSLRRADGTPDLTRGASGTGGMNGAFNLSGWQVTLDAKRGPVLSPQTSALEPRGGRVSSGTNAAPLEGSGWSALPHNGLNGNVWAMALYGNELYVGGEFTGTADGSITNLNHIAKYDGVNWSALPGNGVSGVVRALTVWENKLYIGGNFTQSADGSITNLKYIASYDGTHLAALPHNGLDDAVFALGGAGNFLYVGGGFHRTGDEMVTNLNDIAKFDPNANGGVGEWSAMPGTGLNGVVNAIAPVGGPFGGAGQVVFVGGSFLQTNDGRVKNLNRIAMYDPNANGGAGGWAALPGKGLNSDVFSMALMPTPAGGPPMLYVGGQFSSTSDGSVPNLNHIAKFDGTNWSALAGDGLNDDVYAMTAWADPSESSEQVLYAVGAFNRTGDGSLTLNNIATYDGTNWSELPNEGLDQHTYALYPVEGGVFVGGSFMQAVSPVVTNLNRIAQLTFPAVQSGPTFIVNSTADTDDSACDWYGIGSGNKDCTLREAIHAANAQGGANTIVFDFDGTITLTSSLPTITGDLVVDGGRHLIVLNGANAYRFFRVETALTLTLNHLYLLGGQANPSLLFGNSGGAVYDDGGTLNVYNSSFANNAATHYGGAIFSTNMATVIDSTFDANQAGGLGGGVAGHTVVVINSTFSDNVAPSGAAVNDDTSLALSNSILANSTGPDCSLSGVMGADTHNLIESTGASACGLVNGTNGDVIGLDPKLGVVYYNGGTTPTMALPTDSPALDAGDDFVCGSVANRMDERGYLRPQGGHCDMGAFEKSNTDCVASEKPGNVELLKPTQNQSMNKTMVKLDWSDGICATSYKITVKNTTTHTKVTQTLTASKVMLTLLHGHEKWFVQACNANGCTKSKTYSFTN